MSAKKTSTQSKQVALLLHLARMAYQISDRVQWGQLERRDRAIETQAESILRRSADVIRDGISEQEATSGDVV